MNSESTLSMTQSIYIWVESHGGIAMWIVLLVFILILIGIPLFFKLKNKRNVQQEVSRLKKDLMVWERLTELSKGGESTDKAKEELSADVAYMKELFLQGLRDLKKAHYPKDHPWTIVVGEPRAGKSSLLLCDDLELMNADKTTKASDLSAAAPIRFWNGNQGSILDVEGRIFFDRWMGGSSAEWMQLLKLIRKHHHKFPLSGITIVIPADALLADDKALTRRKAHLIAMELDQLTRVLSMIVPCNVVISKLDEVTGFAQYFEELSETMRRKIFGWQPEDRSGAFDEADFERFWNLTLNRLREGVKKRFVSRSVTGNMAGSARRMDLSSEIFLFPENFNELKENLAIYLEEIFAKNAHHSKQRNLLLEGVFFTSAKSGHSTYNRQFAAAAGRSIDDAPMSLLSVGRSKSFFVRDLFVNWILGEPSRARFTAPEIFRRHLPAYTAICVLGAVSVVWISTALFESGPLKAKLDKASGTVDQLSALFKDESIQKASLINTEADTTFNLQMPGKPQTSRINFYIETLSDLYQKQTVPFGYKASGLMLFGHKEDIERDNRRFLFNEVQTEMAYLPLVKALGTDLLEDKQTPFTEAKRNAVAEYMKISFYREELGLTRHRSNLLYSPSTMRSFLDYLKPDLSEELKSVLTVFDAPNDKSADILNSEIVNSTLYRNASNKAADAWMAAWKDLSIYPYTEYGRMRTAVRLATELNEQYLWLVKAAADPKVTLGQWQEGIAAAQMTASAIKDEDLEIINRLFNYVPAKEKNKDKNKESALEFSEGKLQNALLADALSVYESRLNEDFRIMKRHYKQPQALFDGETVDAETITSLLEKEEKQIRSDLSLEALGIDKSLTALRASALFAVKEADKKAKVETAAEFAEKQFAAELIVFKDILASLSLRRSAVHLSDTSEIETEWSEAEAFFTHKQDVLNSIVKNRPQSAVAPQIAEPASAMIEREKINYLAAVAADSLNLYPKSDTRSGLLAQFRSVAAKANDKGGDESAKSLAVIRKILGPVSYRSVYSKHALDEVIAPLAFVERNLQFLAKKPHSEAVKDLLKSERWKALLRADASFAREFARYWGSFGDMITPRTSGWNSFSEFAKRSHAYEINSELLKIYDFSASMVRQVPDNILDEHAAEEKKSILSMLGQRRQLLSLQYSDSCAQTLASWAVLPSDPMEAYRVIRAMPSAEARATLMLAAGKDVIPWWNAFVNEGAKHLKSAALAGARSKLAAFSTELNRFPISQGADADMPLSSADMQDLAMQLGYDEQKTDKAKEENKDVMSLHTKVNAAVPGLDRKMAVVKLLTAAEAIEFEVVLSDSVTQTVLAKNYSSRIPSAVARYRYVSVDVDGRRELVQTVSSDKEPRVLGSGDLEHGTLRLEFYRFSDAKDAETVIEMNDLWAVLALYLKSNPLMDQDKRTWWCPIILKDKFDEESVFFIGLRFSKPLPSPKKWPR